MRKKFTNRVITFAMTSIMALGMIAGMPQAGVTVKAAIAYGLSNPTKDANGYTVYDCVYFGNYWQTDTNGDGKADKQDAKTPIKWRVLSVDGDDAFLIADQNLDVQRYNDKYEDYTWKTCTMRRWLNETFMGNAFSSAEQAAIKATSLENKDNQYKGTPGGNVTTDSIFLLSLEDIENPAYGFSNFDYDNDNGNPVGKIYYGSDLEEYYSIYDFAKLRTSTAFAGGADGYKVSTDLDTATGYGYSSHIGMNKWWLRSRWAARIGSDIDMLVEDVGYVVSNGANCHIYNNYGVCPVLHLNLSSTDVWSKAKSFTCKPENFRVGDYPVEGSGTPSTKPTTQPSTQPSTQPTTPTKQSITTAKIKTYKAKNLKKKKITIKLNAKTSGNGKLSYKISKYPKKGKKSISVSKKGVVTLKKGAKKGTYKVTITASATSKYKAATKTISIKVK